MITFQQFLENQELYKSLIPPDLLNQREKLHRLVFLAYQKGDHKTAEKLDAQLEELEEKIDSMLEDMDDGSQEDDKGEEEKDIDQDWSVQDEFARIYDQFITGKLHLADSDWELANPDFTQDPEFQRLQKTQGYALAPKGAYKQTPISQQKALANMLRGAIWESPYLSQHQPNTELIKSLSDQQIIDIAKDAWEWKKNLRQKIKHSKPG